MNGWLAYLPVAAAAFGIPQYLPQIVKLRRTQDTAGVSWSWATLTSLNNGAWLAYFVASGYWTAIVPSSAAMLLAGTLAVFLTFRGQVRSGAGAVVAGWATVLIAAYAAAGRAGLGTLLTAAFVVQVVPSVWTAYRTERPTGVSRGTWTLVLCELSCWATFGLLSSDPRLTVLGITGVIASVLMLARIAGRHGVEGDRARSVPSTG